MKGPSGPAAKILNLKRERDWPVYIHAYIYPRSGWGSATAQWQQLLLLLQAEESLFPFYSFRSLFFSSVLCSQHGAGHLSVPTTTTGQGTKENGNVTWSTAQETCSKFSRTRTRPQRTSHRLINSDQHWQVEGGKFRFFSFSHFLVTKRPEKKMK